jgi:hypothetical protein
MLSKPSMAEIGAIKLQKMLEYSVSVKLTEQYAQEPYRERYIT